MPPSSQQWYHRRWFPVAAFIAQVLLMHVGRLSRVVTFCVCSGFGYMWQLDPFYQPAPSNGSPSLMSLRKLAMTLRRPFFSDFSGIYALLSIARFLDPTKG